MKKELELIQIPIKYAEYGFYKLTDDINNDFTIDKLEHIYNIYFNDGSRAIETIKFNPSNEFRNAVGINYGPISKNGFKLFVQFVNELLRKGFVYNKMHLVETKNNIDVKVFKSIEALVKEMYVKKPIELLNNKYQNIALHTLESGRKIIDIRSSFINFQSIDEMRVSTDFIDCNKKTFLIELNKEPIDFCVDVKAEFILLYAENIEDVEKYINTFSVKNNKYLEVK